MKTEVAARIGYHEVVDLRREFPISWKYSFRKNIGWLGVFCAVFGLVTLAEYYAWLPNNLYWMMKSHRQAVYKGIAAVMLMKLIHTELYRLSLYYGTEGFRLVVSRGIILKQRGSLPLLPISEIYIQRGMTDLVCGLCNVNVFTPMDQTRQFARIECLDPETALSLQHFLNDILTNQVFLAPQALKSVEEVGHDQSGPATSDQTMQHDGGGHGHSSKHLHAEAGEAA